jgi:hypothetical protein
MLKLFGLNPHLRGRPLHVLLLHSSAGLLHMKVGLFLNLPTVATERERERREKGRVSEDVSICIYVMAQILREVASSSVVVQTPRVKTDPAKVITTLKLKSKLSHLLDQSKCYVHVLTFLQEM